MLKLAALMMEHREELALLETLDMGKPIGDSTKVDIPGCGHCIAWYGEAVDKVYGEIAPTPASALAMITREPSASSAAIMPWNFPLLMAYVEDRAGARHRQLGGAQARRAVAADGAAARRARARGGRARRRAQRRCPGFGETAGGALGRCTWTSTWSPSRARPRSASASSATPANRT